MPCVQPFSNKRLRRLFDSLGRGLNGQSPVFLAQRGKDWYTVM